MKAQDVIILGAGIIGMSSAYYLQKNNPGKKILVVDREPGAGQGNTAKAAAMFRNTFSSRTSQVLSDTSINFYSHLQNEVNYDIHLKKTGYLWLLGRRQFREYSSIIRRMMEREIEIRILKKDELNKIPKLNLELNKNHEETKYLGLENIHKGLLGSKCGELDQSELVRFYREEFEKLGGETLFNTKIHRLIITPKNEFGGPPFVWQNPKITGVTTNNGEIYGNRIVLATGAYTHELLDPIGIDNHSKPKKRQLFQLECSDLEELLFVKNFNEHGILPFTILPKSEVYIKPDETTKRFWTGCADDLGRPFSLDVTPEKSFYEFNIRPIITKYFPQFENARIANKLAGLYACNTIDGNPYVFEEYGLIVISGCSGSGIMKADAIGRIVDALYRKKEEAELYGSVMFRVSDISTEKRNVENEEFVI
ncbi:MAG: FAD-binding oxidoreductase [Candidatus Bathyarchaeota archaeon]|nr:MAG: FAD-binding oxidoreductase [Candidatus Bathyarchaeota archaeon]